MKQATRELELKLSDRNEEQQRNFSSRAPQLTNPLTVQNKRDEKAMLLAKKKNKKQVNRTTLQSKEQI